MRENFMLGVNIRVTQHTTKLLLSIIIHIIMLEVSKVQNPQEKSRKSN
jgi:hypothetical protein